MTADPDNKRQKLANIQTEDADLEDNDSCDEGFLASDDEEDLSDVFLMSDVSESDEEPLKVKGAEWGDYEHAEPEDDLSDGWSTNSEDP